MTKETQNQSKNIASMFNSIAKHYDFLNRLLSFGQDVRWRKIFCKKLALGKNALVLDLAAGTLDVSKEIVKQYPLTQVLAVDVSLEMLKKGADKLSLSEEKKIMPLLADGKIIPLPDNCIDAVTISFGIRNIIPRELAYLEIARVLKPNGTLCILEFGSGKNKIWKGFYNFYLKRILPIIGKIFSESNSAYKYLAETICAFPTEDELAAELRLTGYYNITHTPLSYGIVQIHVATKNDSIHKGLALQKDTIQNNTTQKEFCHLTKGSNNTIKFACMIVTKAEGDTKNKPIQKTVPEDQKIKKNKTAAAAKDTNNIDSSTAQNKELTKTKKIDNDKTAPKAKTGTVSKNIKKTGSAKK